MSKHHRNISLIQNIRSSTPTPISKKLSLFSSQFQELYKQTLQKLKSRKSLQSPKLEKVKNQEALPLILTKSYDRIIGESPSIMNKKRTRTTTESVHRLSELFSKQNKIMNFIQKHSSLAPIKNSSKQLKIIDKTKQSRDNGQMKNLLQRQRLNQKSLNKQLLSNINTINLKSISNIPFFENQQSKRQSEAINQNEEVSPSNKIICILPVHYSKKTTSLKSLRSLNIEKKQRSQTNSLKKNVETISKKHKWNLIEKYNEQKQKDEEEFITFVNNERQSKPIDEQQIL